MSFLNVIMLILFYPILPIMYFVLRNEIKPRKNIVLGVTLPHDVLSDPDLINICKQFKRALGKSVLLLAFLPFSVFWVQSFSIVMLILMNWLFFSIVIPFIPYTKYHRRLKALKRERECVIGSGQKTLVDLKAAAETEVQANEWLFVPAIIISAFPVASELTVGLEQTHFSVLLGCGVMLLTTILFYMFYLLVSRQRTEIIDEDSTYNMALTRIRRYNWARFWLWAAWINTLYCIVFWLGITDRVSFIIFMISTIIYSGAILWVALKAEFATRNMQYKLAAESTSPIYMDEDSYWINGMFYYNPHDRKTLISNRVGIGMSMNMARPAGKFVIAISLLCILAIPFVPVWLIAEEFTPLSVEVRDSAIVITHLSEIARINVAEIESIELLEELPSTRRIIGTGLENLRKGTFDVDGYGRGRVYLNPQQPPFILIKTQHGFVIINLDESVLELKGNNQER